MKNILNRGGAEYQAIIAFDTSKRKGTGQFGGSFYRRLSLAVAKNLKRHGINFFFWPRFTYTAHIFGEVNKLNVMPCRPELGSIDRLQATLDLILETIKTFPYEFAGKKLDIWLETGDGIDIDLAQAIDTPVFSYCSTPTMQDRCIAFPVYDTCYNEEKFADIYSKCKDAAAKPWQDNRAFWRGSIFTSHTRKFLLELGKKYPQHLRIEDSGYGQFIPMIEQAKYKYLIDTRGNTFSVRLQTLLKLGRVIFIVDRPFREWYFDRMIPMEHYVPVKEDMSDLIEKYLFMERNPGLYKKIVRNLAEFVEENLNPRRILFDTKELLLKYGVVKK